MSAVPRPRLHGYNFVISNYNFVIAIPQRARFVDEVRRYRTAGSIAAALDGELEAEWL